MSYPNFNFEKNKIYSKLAKISNCPFFTEIIFAQIGQRNPDVWFCTTCSTLADTKTLEEEDNGLLRLSDPDSIEVESTYRGVHLTFPLTQAQLQSLIKSFKTKQVLTTICTSPLPLTQAQLKSLIKSFKIKQVLTTIDTSHLSNELIKLNLQNQKVMTTISTFHLPIE